MIGQGAQGAAITPEIRYRNVASNTATTTAALAGDYFVTLTYPTAKGKLSPVAPILLRTAVVGKAGAAPVYADADADAASAVPNSTPANSSAKPSVHSTRWVLIGGLAAAALVLVCVGAGTIRVLKRR